MYDPKFSNTSQGPAKISNGRQAPRTKGQGQGDKGNSLRAAPLKLNETKEIEVGGKEEVLAQEAHALPFPRLSKPVSHRSPCKEET